MRILYKRDVTLNERLIGSGTLNEALMTLASDAARPSRKYKVFRVRLNGQPLFLSKNREVFRTRASAKTALENWLYLGLQDVLEMARIPGAVAVHQLLARRLNCDAPRWHNNSVYALIKEHIKAWEKDGILQFEVVNMDPQEGQPEAIRA